MWERKISINQVKEIRAKTTIFFGVGAIKKISEITQELKKRGLNKIVIVTGKSSYTKTGAWEYVESALKISNIEYVLFNKVTSNPTVDQVDEAASIAKEFGAKAVLGIGGGSPLDTAKSVAILLEYSNNTARDIYEFKFIPEKAAPIITINLTHGTGTEVNRFAVVSIPEKEYKPAIAYDCIYPLYSIDDPELMIKLPVNQTKFVSVDAINHVIEAATSKVASPYSINLAKETIHFVAKYLPQAIENPEDLTARYYLLYASLIAGISFDNGLLHFTHALEHPLSAVKPELSHGLGLAMILPGVIKEIYAAIPEVLADILSPIVTDLKGNPGEAEKAAKGVEEWLYSIGIKSKLIDEGFTEKDLNNLTNLVFTTPSLDVLLSVAPIPADKTVVYNIFRNSLNKK